MSSLLEHFSPIHHSVVPEVLEFAEAMEDSLQAPRIQRLRAIFGHCEERLYVPFESSPQNRCLVASRVDRQRIPTEASDTLLGIIRARVAEEGSRWPLDFRPLGLASSRFDWDGTPNSVHAPVMLRLRAFYVLLVSHSRTYS
jgi:hypothetical protein